MKIAVDEYHPAAIRAASCELWNCSDHICLARPACTAAAPTLRARWKGRDGICECFHRCTLREQVSFFSSNGDGKNFIRFCGIFEMFFDFRIQGIGKVNYRLCN